ncbi:lipoprotein [Vibrio harveyi]|nr:lipoprotein [Vibrio harveyi]
MKKLLTILGSITMTATTGITAVACKSEEKKPDSGSNQPNTPATPTKTNLSTFVKELGEVKDKKDETIIAAFLEKNNEKMGANKLANEDLKAENITDTKATISLSKDHEKYEGTVEVTFKVQTESSEQTTPTKTNLSTFVKELGEVKDKKDETIIAAFLEKNNEKMGANKLAKEDLKAENITDTKATISLSKDHEKYEGTVEVTFKVQTESSEQNQNGGEQDSSKKPDTAPPQNPDGQSKNEKENISKLLTEV